MCSVQSSPQPGNDSQPQSLGSMHVGLIKKHAGSFSSAILYMYKEMCSKQSSLHTHIYMYCCGLYWQLTHLSHSKIKKKNEIILMITCTGFLTNCEPVRDASRESLFYKSHELSYQSGIFLVYLFI